MILPGLVRTSILAKQKERLILFLFFLTTGLIPIRFAIRRFASAIGAGKATGYDQFDAVILNTNRRSGTFYVHGYSWQLMDIKLHRNYKCR